MAYFRVAKKYHPDTNKTAQARFMFAFAAEAYEVLSDPESVSSLQIPYAQVWPLTQFFSVSFL